MSDLVWLSAAEAASLIRQRKLSPVEYMDAVLARIESLQPRLNCFATVTADAARDAARRAEQSVMDGVAARAAPWRAGQRQGPDRYRGRRDRARIGDLPASRPGPRQRPRDAAQAGGRDRRRQVDDAGIRAQGLHRQSGLRHHAQPLGPVADGRRLERRRGRGGRERTGASRLGTDGAGSIRIPAAACGIVGHKPTLGMVPYEGTSENFSNYAYAGPMTRTIADAAVMLEAIAGRSDTDPLTMHPGETPLRPNLVGDRLDGFRIGTIRLAANREVDPEVEAAMTRMLHLLEDRGAVVEPCPTIDWEEPAGRILYMGGQAAAYGGYVAEWGDRMDPIIRDFIAEGMTLSLVQYRQAQFARTRLFKAVQGLFHSHDVLLTPTLPRDALPASFRSGHDSVPVNGVDHKTSRLGWAPYCYPFNLTGHPALTVPSGWNAAGLPMGVQLVGPYWADMDLLRIGAILESAAPWRSRKPDL